MKPVFYLSLLLVFSSCSKQAVEQFGIFEIEINNNSHYQNPYFDVDLKVEFESPLGTKIQHFGFYYGNNTWKIRFMPNKTGSWKFTAKFSDGTKAESGKFVCVKSWIKGPLSKFKKNPIWLATQNGEPFLMRSFHVGDCFFADNWTDSLQSDSHPRTKFLSWLEENKYNTLSIASFFTNRNSEGRGIGWDTPEMWPLNSVEFQKAEVILDELAEREIYVFPFAGFFGRDGNWPTEHAEQEQYVKYILARWGAYYNLIFNVAGPEPFLDGKPEHKAGYKNKMEMEDIERIAKWIKKYDVSNHLITVHNRTKASSEGDPFRNEDWYELSTIQGPKTKNLKLHEKTVTKIRNPEKPYYAQETLWGGNMYHPDYGVEYIRKIGIVLTMNAAMINFADNNGNSSSGFSGSLNFADCKQNEHDALKIVWDFFETLPFGEMRPDTLIAPSKFVLAGKNQILIYSEKQDSFQLNLKEDKIYRAEWINAQQSDEIIKIGYVNPGESVTSPDFADDWILNLSIEEKPAQVAEGNFPDIAVDKNGNIHLVYNRNGLKYRMYSEQIKKWLDEENVGCDCENVQRSDPDIVIDSKGNPHMFCGKEFASKENGKWKFIQPVASRDSELAIDENDNIYLVHREGNNGGFIGLLKLEPGENEWKTLTDPDKNSPGPNNHVYCDLTIFPIDNSIHLVQRHGHTLEVNYMASFDGGLTWPVDIPVHAERSEAPHIALDNDGKVYITTGHGRALYYDGDSFVDEGLIVKGQHRRQPELGADNKIMCIVPVLKASLIFGKRGNGEKLNFFQMSRVQKLLDLLKQLRTKIRFMSFGKWVPETVI